MALPLWLGDIFGPIADLVDELHTSKEEKEQLKITMLGQQTALAMKVMEYEVKQAEHQKDIIIAEAQGQSFLQRNWRPITMLTFLVLVVCDSFGLLAFRLSDEAWTLLQIGLGGYVVGRSMEKIVPKVADTMKK